MAKRARHSYVWAKKQKGDNGSGDRISTLPDDVLVSILSFLTMEQAARTSVLSKRWRDTWAYTSNLNFDASQVLEDLQRKKSLIEVARPKYVTWVNQVVRSHKGPTIDEFRVRFNLNRSYRYHIDSWVNFAIQKRVKRLELDLSTSWGCLHMKSYSFPEKWYTAKCLRSRPLGFSSCNSLKVLKLKCLNVKAEVLEYFLFHCPVLEQLCVEGSNSLGNLKVAGPSLRLKYLEINHCSPMESLEISAKNLVSFKYCGPKINLHFQDTPHLAEISVGGHYGLCLIYNNLAHFSSYLSCIETLVLELAIYEESMDSLEFPILNNLKQLELKISAHDDDSLLGFTSLIEASPFLYKFSLELDWNEPSSKRKAQKAKTCYHQHLKVVELVGFVGRTIDIELAMYFIENAVVLEKIVIDPQNPLLINCPWVFEEAEQQQAARKCAKRLAARLRPGVSLIIL